MFVHFRSLVNFDGLLPRFIINQGHLRDDVRYVFYVYLQKWAVSSGEYRNGLSVVANTEMGCQ